LVGEAITKANCLLRDTPLSGGEILMTEVDYELVSDFFGGRPVSNSKTWIINEIHGPMIPKCAEDIL
jgi:hypothetical protein